MISNKALLLHLHFPPPLSLSIATKKSANTERRYSLTITSFAYWSVADVTALQTGGKAPTEAEMPQPSRQGRALTHAPTVAMDSISSVASQALADVAPLRVDALGHAPVAAVRACCALVHVCGTQQGTGHWVRNQHSSQYTETPAPRSSRTLCSHLAFAHLKQMGREGLCGLFWYEVWWGCSKSKGVNKMIL